MGTERLSAEAIATLRRVLAEATKGEWTVETMRDFHCENCHLPDSADKDGYVETTRVVAPYAPNAKIALAELASEPVAANAALIVAAVNALPSLLDEIQQGREKMTALRTVYRRWSNTSNVALDIETMEAIECLRDCIGGRTRHARSDPKGEPD